MSYKNLSKQAQPKKALDALKKIKEMKEGDSKAKEGINLASFTKELAQKRLDSENEDSKE